MAKKFYAVKEGYDALKGVKIENKIVDTWNECLKYVKGVKGAKYKSFESLKDAEEYLKDDKKLLKKGVDFYPQDCLHIYVDGSYNISTEKFSYGIVAIKNDVITYVESGSAEDSSQKQLRQIAGELMGAARALEYAVKLNEKKLVIFHDYEGIFHHAVGTWGRKDDSSKKYYSHMNSIIEKNNIELYFVKIDSHTGDIYNEIADSLAKFTAGMNVTAAVDKWLSHNVLYVADEELEFKVRRIVNNQSQDKIKVVRHNDDTVNITNPYADNAINKVMDDYIKELKILADKTDDEINRYIVALDDKTKDSIILELVKLLYN
jgi:viroplasmin and RNaseH domain-containing protein